MGSRRHPDADGNAPTTAPELPDSPPLSLRAVDAEALVRLVGEVCDPAIALSVNDRRARLAQGLVELVDADSWISYIACSKPENRANFAILSSYDGGWRDEQQRIGVLGLCMDFDEVGDFNRILSRCFDDMQVHVYTRQMMIDDAMWSQSVFGKKCNALGIDQFLIAIYPMAGLLHSAIGVHRKLGRPAFTGRERTLAHLLWEHTAWLHRQETQYPVGADPCDLNWRERQVLVLLLGGSTCRAAADLLELSEHTVGDYIKAIYRKLGVNSRAQLLAKFLPSSGTT